MTNDLDVATTAVEGALYVVDAVSGRELDERVVIGTAGTLWPDAVCRTLVCGIAETELLSVVSAATDEVMDNTEVVGTAGTDEK